MASSPPPSPSTHPSHTDDSVAISPEWGHDLVYQRDRPSNRKGERPWTGISDWTLTLEVLSPHVQKLVAVGVRRSQGPKSDKIDAFALAEKLRIGDIETRVYKKRGEYVARGRV